MAGVFAAAGFWVEVFEVGEKALGLFFFYFTNKSLDYSKVRYQQYACMRLFVKGKTRNGETDAQLSQIVMKTSIASPAERTKDRENPKSR